MRIETSEHNTRWVEITMRKFKTNFTANKVLINLKDISKLKDSESKLSAKNFIDSQGEKKNLSIGRDLTESKTNGRTVQGNNGVIT